MEAVGTSICLVMKAVLVSARWAGRSRRLGLERAAEAAGDGAEAQAENVLLRDAIELLAERLACAERRLKAAHLRKPYSRAVMAVVPLEGPNAGWLVGAMEEAFLRHGAPRHLISDQEKVFLSDTFRDLLIRWDVKPRCGAVGQHGSIAVTERVIRTLKYEWLKRVPLIKGLDHLQALLADFACYYNSWRPHTTLNGAVPEVIHAGQQWSVPPKTAKALPAHIERRFFPETRIKAFRLAA